jgi:ankyrin repeat protein
MSKPSSLAKTPEEVIEPLLAIIRKSDKAASSESSCLSEDFTSLVEKSREAWLSGDGNLVKLEQLDEIEKAWVPLYHNELGNIFVEKGMIDISFSMWHHLPQSLIASIPKGVIDSYDKKGNTLLGHATRKGGLDNVKFLIEAGADVCKGNIRDRKPLHNAASQSNLKITKLLVDIDKGACVNSPNRWGETPLHEAASHEWGADTVSFLIDVKAKVYLVDSEGQTALHLAAKQNNPDIALALIKAKANIHATDNEGTTPLHWAAESGHPDTLKALLAAGADKDVNRISRNNTPLQLAVKSGDLDTVKALLEAKADIHARDEYGRTPLHVAAYAEHPTAIKALLEARADVDATDNEGRTALYLAEISGRTELVACLEAHKAQLGAAQGPASALDTASASVEVAARVAAKDTASAPAPAPAPAQDSAPAQVEAQVLGQVPVPELDLIGDSPW